MQLRFTTKFDAVEPLLALDHRGRTRMRASINPAAYARFEGGTSPVAARLRRAAQDGGRGLQDRPDDRADHRRRGLARRRMAS